MCMPWENICSAPGTAGGACGGAGLELAAGGECLIVRWDANSNGRWETSPAAAGSTGFRLRDGALETLRGASDCRGGGWEKITNPAAIVVTRFSVQRQVTPGLRAGAERDAGGALRATDGP